MTRAWVVLFAIAISSVTAGCSDECSGPACVTDAGMGDAGPEDAGMADAGPCDPYDDVNACVARGDCPSPVTLDVEEIASILTNEMDNPEIVGFIPGSDDRALVIFAVTTQLAEIRYSGTGLEIVRKVLVETGSDTTGTPAIAIAPNGEYAAIAVGELAGCAPGRVLFVDIADSDAFGALLGEAPIGYAPDSLAFSPDGLWLVTADEGDREDHPCDALDPLLDGGSVTIVNLSGGPTRPAVAQTIPVNHDPVSEPEGVAISDDGTVVVTIQETSELGFFSLADVPSATLTRVTLPGQDGQTAGPDGVEISEDGRWAAVALEHTDELMVLDLDATPPAITHRYDIVASGDVPDEYNRDERDIPFEIHEPEQVTFLRSQGALFAVYTYQQSNAVAAYLLDETTGTLTLDSITQVGFAWMMQINGREGGDVEPEGISSHPISGLLLTANEDEGSISLLRTGATSARSCP